MKYSSVRYFAMGRMTFFGIVLVCVALAVCRVAWADGTVSNPEKILFNDAYYEIPNPQDAASKMLADAQDLGIDILDPGSQPLPSFASDKQSGPVCVLHFATASVSVDLEDRSFADSAASATDVGRGDEWRTAVVVSRRQLSIRDMADLLSRGVRVLWRLGGTSQLVISVKNSEVAAITYLDYVVWVGEFGPEFKRASTWGRSPSNSYDIEYFGRSPDSFVEELVAHGFDVEGVYPRFGVISVTGPWERIGEIEELLWVKQLYPSPVVKTDEVSSSPMCADAAKSVFFTPTFPAQQSRILAGGGSIAGSGGGVIIGIRDRGLDPAHAAISGKLRSHSLVPVVSNRRHGTAVASIAVGANDGCPGEDTGGMAPDAAFVFRPLTENINASIDAFSIAEILISNHSYSEYTAPAYTPLARLFDQWCRSGAFVVASVGNIDERDYATAPGSAKNVLAVGAIQHVDANVAFGGGNAVHAGEISGISRTGPTQPGGRLKPDLVAPGGSSIGIGRYDVIAARADSGEIICGTYTGFGGTSAAAPHVAGAAADVVAALGHRPSSQLLKALMINAAIPLKGNLGVGLPDDEMHRGYASTTYGYGLVNAIGSSANLGGDGPTDPSFTRVVFEDSLDTGSFRPHSFDAVADASGRKPRKIVVTLAYNDLPASNGSIGSLVDDLDLTLRSSSRGLNIVPSLAAGVSEEGPIEKIIVEGDDLSGDWSAIVDYPTGQGVQPYAIVVDVHYSVPALAIAVDPVGMIRAGVQNTVFAGREYTVEGTVVNHGGLVAGTRIWFDSQESDALSYDTILDYPTFLGNLMDPSTGHHSVPFKFKLSAPAIPGTYHLSLRADGVNIEFADHEARADIELNVLDPRGGKSIYEWYHDDDIVSGLAITSEGECFVVGTTFYGGYNGRLAVQKLDPMGTPQFEAAESGYMKAVGAGSFSGSRYHFWSKRAGLVVVAPYVSTGVKQRIHIHNDGTFTSQALLSATSHGPAYAFANDTNGGLYIGCLTDSEHQVYLEWQDCATNVSWVHDVGIRGLYSDDLHLYEDGLGGVFVTGRGLNDSGDSGVFVRHYDATGISWPNPVKVGEQVWGVSRAVAAPDGGLMLQLNDGFVRRIENSGGLPWGSAGRALPANWRILGGDSKGGFYANNSSNAQLVGRFSEDLESHWDPAGVSLLPDCSSGPGSFGSVSLGVNGRGNVCVGASTYRPYPLVPASLAYLQEFDEFSAAQWDPCVQIEDGDSQSVKILGPDGTGGIFCDVTVSGPSTYYRTLRRISGAVDRPSRVMGRVLDAMRQPIIGYPVVARDPSTSATICRALTGNDGTYELTGIPAFCDVEIAPENPILVSPSRYHYEVLTSDQYCSFELRAPPGSWTTDLSTPPMVGQYRVTNDAEFADLDGDGALDMYLCYGEAEVRWRYTQANKLLQNVGEGSFADVTALSGDGAGWIGPTISAAIADMDNDGDQDMYLSNGDALVPTSVNVLVANARGPNGPNLSVVDPAMYPLAMRDPNPGGRAEWIDFNGDGFLDLYVGRPGMSSLVFRGFVESQTAGFQSVSVPGLTDAASNGFSSWADFDGDGYVDVLVFGPSGANKLLRNNGDWTFADVTSYMGGASAVEGLSRSAAWGDYDNDGDIDLFMNFDDDTTKRLFRNNGSVFDDVTEAVGLSTGNSPSSAAAWSDFDNDGDLDLMISGAPTTVWENRSNGASFVHSPELDLQSRFAPNTLALGDVDSDGDEDVYLGVTQPYSSLSGEHSIMYTNEYGDYGKSIGVDLRSSGSHCNRDGIGAVVRVMADGETQTRQMTGMVGGTAHGVRTQKFGLGLQEVATKVQVKWPWGRLTEVPLVPAGSTIVVTDELAAPQAGAIYLTTSSSGARTQPSGDYELGDYVDFYLAADFSGVAVADQLLGGYEIEVKKSAVLYDMTIEPLVAGVDSDSDPWKFSVHFNSGVALNQGPVTLVHFRGQLYREGADAAIGLGARVPCSFTDPLEPASACWWGGDSGVLYRFEETFVDNGITYHIPDTKAPLIAWAGLYPWNPAEPRSWVAVAFDEPLSDSCFLPEFYLNFSRIFNPTNPSITKSVSEVWPMGEKTYWLHLTTPIQAGKLFDLEAMGVSDRVGNVRDSTIHNVCNEENPDVDFNELFFAVAKNEGGGASVEWVELYNAEDAPVCINGWSVSNGTGGVLHAPYEPLCILPPGGHVVLAAAGTDTTLFDEDIVLVCASSRLELSNSTLALLSPFGVQADEFDAGAAKARAAGSSCSVQRFTNQHTKSTSWEFDGPDFAPGRRGTPGFDNQRADGTGNGVDLPAIGRTGLLYAAPNPFNPATDIYLALRAPGRVTIKIYDIMGRVVRTLMDEERHESALLHVTWNGLNEAGLRCASGVYLVKMDAQDCDPRSLKITLLK